MELWPQSRLLDRQIEGADNTSNQTPAFDVQMSTTRKEPDQVPVTDMITLNQMFNQQDARGYAADTFSVYNAGGALLDLTSSVGLNQASYAKRNDSDDFKAYLTYLNKYLHDAKMLSQTVNIEGASTKHRMLYLELSTTSGSKLRLDSQIERLPAP